MSTSVRARPRLIVAESDEHRHFVVLVTFDAGDLDITATTRDGHKVVDVQEWSRAVEIVPAP